MQKNAPRSIIVVLLYVFGTAIALYPPLAQFSQPIIIASFLLILLVVLYEIIFSKRSIPNSALYGVVGVLSFVYIFWLYIAILYDNNITYALQDSLGFAIYLFLTPVFFIFIRLNKLDRQFLNLSTRLSTFIASISLGIVVWYYISFGAVEAESLLAMNVFIKSLGLNWMIDNNSGFLGLYTYTSHFLLLGIGLAFYNFYTYKKPVYLYLIILNAFGILADGHRALVISMLLLMFLLLPLIKQVLPFKKLITYFLIVTILLLVAVALNFEWIQERFNFSASDDSTLERFLQIPALLDKIMDSPIFGSGFGSFARVIRSTERPFSYEVDFLAVIMKLGFFGSLLYFGTYLYMLDVARRFGGVLGYVLFCVGLSFLLYMGTNGNQAMSTDSAVFHMFLFILIALSVKRSFVSITKRDVACTS